MFTLHGILFTSQLVLFVPLVYSHLSLLSLLLYELCPLSWNSPQLSPLSFESIQFSRSLLPSLYTGRLLLHLIIPFVYRGLHCSSSCELCPLPLPPHYATTDGTCFSSLISATMDERSWNKTRRGTNKKKERKWVPRLWQKLFFPHFKLTGAFVVVLI